jgi:hypothetical protein
MAQDTQAVDFVRDAASQLQAAGCCRSRASNKQGHTALPCVHPTIIAQGPNKDSKGSGTTHASLRSRHLLYCCISAVQRSSQTANARLGKAVCLAAVASSKATTATTKYTVRVYTWHTRHNTRSTHKNTQQGEGASQRTCCCVVGCLTVSLVCVMGCSFMAGTVGVLLHGRGGAAACVHCLVGVLVILHGRAGPAACVH